MRIAHFPIIRVTALLLIVIGTFSCDQKATTIQRSTDFNFDWKFKLVNDTALPSQLPLADDDWRDLRLPHDWSVEFSFDSTLEGCTGYLPGGVGIYQKHFSTPDDTQEKNVYALFDGVYNNATFWVNGHLLGTNPYGYSPVYFDLTGHLKTDGGENVLTVHVDHSRYADSRWYTGSGIYRNVELITTSKLHIPIWGTFVTTPEITEDAATVTVEVSVDNEQDSDQSFELATRIYDASGKVVAEASGSQKISAFESQTFDHKLEVSNPQLWNIDSPKMYKAITEISQDGELVDVYETPFGIRSLRFDKDQGFFLNGKSTYVKGVCLHHDAGLVGAAVPKGVWRRRLQALKDAGVNAVRTSHNPFSEEFLDLCDEMGLLVQNEIFDEMDNPKDKRYNKGEQEPLYITEGYDNHFQEWAESDLRRTVLRDRNHPSVFMWSIGNEIEWTYPHYMHVSGLWEGKGGYWNKIPTLTPEEMRERYEALPEREYVLSETAQKLSDWVKELDTTRPVTANLIIPVASLATGYADALDVVGFSYQIAQYDWSKKHYPDMHFTGNENSGYLSEWNSIIEKPYVFSMYMWTGIDYMGESTDRWPQKAWPGDMLDLAGFKKPGWYNFKKIWVNEPDISITTKPLEGSKFKKHDQSGQAIPKNGKTPNWNNYGSNFHWNYEQGEEIIVEVRSNLHVVELFLNGKSLGSRSMSESPDRIFRWIVPYEEGTLVARGGFSGAEVEANIQSSGSPDHILLTVDKTELNADGYDVAHLVAQIVDAEGIPVQTEEAPITFQITGDVTLLGVDNGSNKSTQDYQANSVITSNGKCLAIIQSKKKLSGEITITAKADGLKSGQVKVSAL